MSFERHWEIRELSGVPIDGVSMDEMLEVVDEAIVARRRLRVGVVNAAKLVHMRRDPALRAAVLSSDLIVADGMSVVWACRLLGRALPERVPGIDLMEGILRRGQSRGYRVFLLGATDAVLETMIAEVHRGYSGVRIVGSHNGYFGVSEEQGIADAIARCQPDVVFLGMTSPKKEEFLARWSPALDVPVWHGVGGAFDVMAGKVRRAPLLWQRLGLEWLYRVYQEPRRMWKRYLVTNTLFIGMVAAEWLERLRPVRG